MNDPLDKIWFDYLFDILYSIKDFTDSIPKKSSGVNSEFYTRQDILAGIDAWMRGGWYEEISIVLGVSVERCLEFFSFVEFQLQSIAASVIKYIEMKRDDAENVTSATIINWPNFLIYGVSSNVGMDLVDINIPDRLLVLGTSLWLQENQVQYDGRESLRGVLKDNRQALTVFLAGRLPRLSMIALENYFGEI